MDRREIGASEIAIIIHGTTQQRWNLWQAKTGRSEDRPSQSAITGLLVEPALVSVAEKIIESKAVEMGKSYYRQEGEYVCRATSDAILEDGTTLECKYYQTYTDKHYQQHELQVQVQLYVCRAKMGRLLVLHGNSLDMYEIQPRDISGELETVFEWWSVHVEGDVPPPPPVAARIENHFVEGSVVVASQQLVFDVQQYRKFRDMKKTCENTMVAIREAVLEYMYKAQATCLVDGTGNVIAEIKNDRLYL